MVQRTGGGATTSVVVPVKAFSRAKARLAGVLSPGERSELARSMATTVVAAAGGLPLVVVCDDEQVRSWAESLGVEVVWTPGLGLNGAVGAAVDHLRAQGVDRAIVAHADLPLATDLAAVDRGDGVTIVPDRHDDGTNVICLPTAVHFGFAYGAGSFTAHRAEALRLGLEVTVVRDERLGWDVDRPVDLELPALDPRGASCR